MDSQSQDDEVNTNDEDDADTTKPPRGAQVNKWSCPECGQVTTFYIGLLEPPTCQNPNEHQDKTVKMEPAV